MPGYGLTLGYTLTYLSLIVLIPLAGLLLRPVGLGWQGFWNVVSAPRVVAALELSFGAALVAAAVNAVFGGIVAWVLVRYEFPGRRIIDALVDLPFALPTAVAGIALTALYAPNGWIGAWLEPMGIKVAFTRLGIMVALTFIGLPFVVRTLEPVLQDLDPEFEEAAATLGAGRLQTFLRVVFPAIMPALLTGVAPLLMPNPFFPDAVRWVHFAEVTSENFVFAVVVAWLWGPLKLAQPSNETHSPESGCAK